MTYSKKFIVKSEEKRIIYGEVYIPLHVDTQGETATADEIEKMAHDFIATGKINKIDISHNYKESGCKIVESFIARKNDSDGFVEGAWVIGVKVTEDNIWENIVKGEINGFSFGGKSLSKKMDTIVRVSKKMIGETEDSIVPENIVPTHSHSIAIELTDDGNIIDSLTSISLGHSHQVCKFDSTEDNNGHNHRIILINK